MANTLIEMTEDEFDDQYPLLANHLNPHSGWVVSETGCLFETYGEELAFVRRQHPSTVWTLLDGDDGDQYLVSGYHFVNRIGYLVSTVAIPEGVDIQVRIPMQAEPGDETVEPEGGPDPTDQRLEAIAHDYLGIPTLDVRNSDSLDFHSVSVWQVKAALEVAFLAGSAVVPPSAPVPELPTRFDAYEIHGVRRLHAIPGCEEERPGVIGDDCEQVPDEEAESWSLFGHVPGRGLECVGDFPTREHAEEVFARITGRVYSEGTSPGKEQE